MSQKAVNSALYGTAALFLFLVSLYALPPLFQRTTFDVQFPKTVSKNGVKRFPIDRELPILKGKEKLQNAKKGKTSLKEIIEQAKVPVIVNFWATWCPPCVEELPSLEFLNRQLSASKGTTPLVVTISVDDRPEDINRFYKTLDFEPTLIVLHDIDGDLARSVGTVKFPETYWVDGSGNILHKWVGPQAWLSREVIEKLALPPSPNF